MITTGSYYFLLALVSFGVPFSSATEYDYEYQSCEVTEVQNHTVSVKRIIKLILLFIFAIGTVLLIFSSNSLRRDNWTQTNGYGQILIGRYQIHKPLIAAGVASDFKKSLRKRPIIDNQNLYQKGEDVYFYAKEQNVEEYLEDLGSSVRKNVTDFE